MLIGRLDVKLKDSVAQAFGRERLALIETEIQQLTENNYSREALIDFLQAYSTPAGAFYMLSALRRSKLEIKDMKAALDFLFNPTPTIMKALHAILSPNSRILDFGCGRGQLTCALALRGFDASGVDISSETLTTARQLARRLNCQTTFSRVRNNQIPFPDKHFDVILSFWVFHEIQKNRLPRVAEELHRTLRKDGYAVIIDQEGVTRFDPIRSLMKQHGFEPHSEKALAPVYDHGKASRAIMLTFVRT